MEEHSGLSPDKTWIANKRLDCFGMCSVGGRENERVESWKVGAPYFSYSLTFQLSKTWVDRRGLHPLRDLHRVECCDYTTDNMELMIYH